jgi:hypothetical protein
LHNQQSISVKTGEIAWLFKIEDTIEVLERCIRLSVRTARRSVKSLSNLEKIARCIAGTAFQSTKIAVAKKMFLGRESDNREKPPDYELVL